MDQYVAAASAELRAAQGRAKLSNVALAAKSGIPLPTLRRYLNGERDTPVSALFRIANALGVDAGRLLNDAADRVEDA
ncbi:transcriptional regulator with XRE-family HTH domain [Microbacterium proteolyticum]|uniref:Transcriptional regulator with XRE-family HTH domain n=1 Tax=Microbacterium proteolyticum TaxID=1572644 RepID=A0A7W5CJ39_9MICO|nr:helix-turn-helix transcriptional regulator [Microbacterium proteolyticum]MBB3158234.1 transcriptional regulator with XRE-family HTH domain [Microbacterium proteolyticum]